MCKEIKRPLNRLNANESRIWDRCYRYFIRTGEWPMGMTDENKPQCHCDDCNMLSFNKLTDDPKLLEDMDENATPFEAPMVKSLMARPEFGPGGSHPVSRDWFFENLYIKCGRTSCAANFEQNHEGHCGVVSRIEINKDGKCKGYQKGSCKDPRKKD